MGACVHVHSGLVFGILALICCKCWTWGRNGSAKSIVNQIAATSMLKNEAHCEKNDELLKKI